MTPQGRIVLDASVYVAKCLAAEPRHAEAMAMVAPADPTRVFLVPDVFRLEVGAALARRQAAAAVLSEVELDLRSAKFDHRDVTSSLIDRAVTVAQVARLRAYDALYVALALQENARLATLNDEVRERVNRCYAGLLLD